MLQCPCRCGSFFDVARGTLVYSLMFYPLLTLAQSRCFVFDVAASEKCKQLNAPAKVKIFRRQDQLAQEARCHQAARGSSVRQVLRHLRNMTSHPSDQLIMPPAEALHVVEIALELINRLFGVTTGQSGP